MPPAGLGVAGQGAFQVGAAPDCGGCGQQAGGCEDAVGLPVQGLVVAGAEPADVLADRGGQAGVHEVLAEGPGPAEEGADHSQVGEGAGGVFGGVLRAEQGEEVFLDVQGSRAGPGTAVLAGLVQADAAGRAVPAGSSCLQGQAALGRMQGAGGGEGDEPPGGRAAGMRLRAALAQEPLVLEAGEGDRQVPGLLPRAAVLLLDEAAVPREAVGAVADASAEQPAVEHDGRVRPDPGASDRRVAVRPGGNCQGACLVGGQPGGLGEALDVEVEQEAPPDDRRAVVGASGEPCEVEGADAQPPGEPEEVSAQGLARDRVQASRQRPRARAGARQPADLSPWSSNTVFRGLRFFFGCCGGAASSGMSGTSPAPGSRSARLPSRMAAPASSSGVSRSSPVAIAWAQPSSIKRRSRPTMPWVRRNRYSGISPEVSMPPEDRRSRSWSSIPARCSRNAVIPAGVA